MAGPRSLQELSKIPLFRILRISRRTFPFLKFSNHFMVEPFGISWVSRTFVATFRDDKSQEG